MPRPRVDQTLVDTALAMRESGAPIAEILAATGLSQGTYYTYVHAQEAEIERRYAEDELKSPLTWPGSKASELEHILPHIPKDFDRYVEPFLGGGSLFWYLKPERALLGDASPELIGFYGTVRDRYQRLHGELTMLERACAEADDDGRKALYDHMRDVINGRVASEVSPEAAFLYVNKTSFSGLMRRNRAGEFNVPYGKGKTFHADTVTAIHSRALRGAELMCCDFADTLVRCEDGDFVFLDPPYDSTFADYSAPFGHEEHERLAEVFYNLPCAALMVVGRTSLTMSLYGNDVLEEYVRDYSVNVRGRVSSSAVHLIVGHRQAVTKT